MIKPLELSLSEMEIKILLLLLQTASDCVWSDPETKYEMRQFARRVQFAVKLQVPHLLTFIQDKGGIGDF
jgi:hypothetical protein